MTDFIMNLMNIIFEPENQAYLDTLQEHLPVSNCGDIPTNLC